MPIGSFAFHYSAYQLSSTVLGLFLKHAVINKFELFVKDILICKVPLLIMAAGQRSPHVFAERVIHCNFLTTE